MWILYDNIVVFAVTLLAGVYAWLFGGTDATLVTPVVPWIFALLVEVMFCFPQRHAGETTYEARARVWDAMKHDPVFWTSLVFVLLLCVPFFNTGLCPICDYDAILAGAIRGRRFRCCRSASTAPSTSTSSCGSSRR